MIIPFCSPTSLSVTNDGSLHFYSISSVPKLWLGGREVVSSIWNWTRGSYVTWSLWDDGGRDPGQLGCMVLDVSTRRMREEPCDSTDVAGFVCRKSSKYVISQLSFPLKRTKRQLSGQMSQNIQN